MFIVGSLNHHKVESPQRLYSDSSILLSILTKCIFCQQNLFPIPNAFKRYLFIMYVVSDHGVKINISDFKKSTVIKRHYWSPPSETQLDSQEL